MKFVLICILQILIFINTKIEAQIVNTTYGAVQGTILLSRGGRDISGFLGIPYGNGSIRFQPPQRPEKWEGIRDSTSYGHVCPQYAVTETNSTGDEDCLTLNVFTPAKYLQDQNSTSELLPVLVYIHGGFFMVLSGSTYGPRYLLDHDIVFVSFNYRLGPFGFLGIPGEADAPGNSGMKDQVLLLKWVQENIHNFGGDASRVIIYGESAGAASIQYHLLSPLSKGLFSAAISGSGTAFKLYSHQVSPVKTAEKLADEVGCGSTIGNHTEMLACLRSVDTSVIASVSNEFTKVLKDHLRISAPLTESSETENHFISQDPYEIFSNGQQQNVPWMVGVNSGEGFLTTLEIYGSDEWTTEINENWANGLSSKFLLYNESDMELTNAINEFYLNATITNGSIDIRKDFLAFTNIFSDRLYIHASIEAARMQAALSPVYLYYNDYLTVSNSVGLGTIHGEELALIFSPANFSAPIIDEGHPDYEQSIAMVNLWVQFMRNPRNITYKGQLWTPVQSFEEGPTCLVFANANRGEQGVAKLPEEIVRRVNFWKANGVPPYQENEQ